MERQESRCLIASSESNFLASVLTLQTIVTQPAEINKSAVISFFGTKRSPSQQNESNIEHPMAKAALQPIIVRSKCGIMKTWPQLASTNMVVPTKNLHEQYVFATCD